MASEQVDSSDIKGGSMEHVEGPPAHATDAYKHNVNAKSVCGPGRFKDIRSWFSNR